MNQAATLLYLLAFPGALALAVMLVPRKYEDLARTVSISATGGFFLLLASLFFLCRIGIARELAYSVPLISMGSKVAANFAIKADCLTMIMLLLVSLIFFVTAMVSVSVKERVKELYSLLLIIQFGVFGTLLASDLLMFFIFWAIVLIPLPLIILLWGGERKQQVAATTFVYMLLGLLIMLIGLIGFSLQSGSFDLLKPGQITMNSQLFLFWLFFTGFAIAIPLFPLHSWFADAHEQAPTAGSLIIAGIIQPMGAYGMLRVLLPLFPYGSRMYASFIAALGVINIIYGAMLALRERNISRMLAYFSMSQVGFAILAYATLGSTGFQAGIFQIISLALISSVLFTVTGEIRRKTGQCSIDKLSGLRKKMPHLFGISLLACFAAVGLPGLSGFIGLFNCLLTGYHGFLGLVEFRYLTIVAVLGVILTAVFLFKHFLNMFSGEEDEAEETREQNHDCQAFSISPLCFMIIYLGIAPFPFFAILEETLSDIARIFQ